MDLPPGVDLVARHRARPRPGRDATRCARLSPARLHAPSTTTAPSGVQDVDLDGLRRRARAAARPGRVGQVEPARRPGRAGQHHRRGPLERPRRRRPPGRAAARPGLPRRAGAAGALGHLHATTSPSTTTAAPSMPALEPRGWAATSPRRGGRTPLVGHRGVRLSGGQVQRLALARALACDADLLLADDVSSALDATTEIELWAALRARRRDRHRRDQQGGRPRAGRPGRRARRRPGRRRRPVAELSARWAPPRGLSPPCRRLVGWEACASSSPEHRVSSAPT